MAEGLIEQAKLENLEAVIAAASTADIDRGEALHGINKERLYKVRGFGSFDLYCDEFHGMSPSRAYQLIDLFSVSSRLSTFVDKDKPTEFHARELKRLPAAEQADAWAEVIERAAGERITAKLVEQVVSHRLTANEPEPEQYPSGLTGVTDNLQELIDAGHKFGTIYADPPWRYDNRGTRSACEDEYDGTMTVEDICAMPVEQLAAENAHLHLWVTAAFLFDAARVIEAWGFEYRTYAVWCKPQIGIGNYWRKASEILLLGIRGNAKSFAEHTHRDWFEIPRGEHSAKPDQIRGVIERVSPGPRLELFGRRQIADWQVFGNQVREALFPT